MDRPQSPSMRQVITIGLSPCSSSSSIIIILSNRITIITTTTKVSSSYRLDLKVVRTCKENRLDLTRIRVDRNLVAAKSFEISTRVVEVDHSTSRITINKRLSARSSKLQRVASTNLTQLTSAHQQACSRNPLLASLAQITSGTANVADPKARCRWVGSLLPELHRTFKRSKKQLEC